MLRDSTKGTRLDGMEVSKRPASWATVPLTTSHLAKEHSFLCTTDVLSLRAKTHMAIKYSIILTAQFWNFTYNCIIHIVTGDMVASSLCLHRVIIDAKSEEVSPCFSTGEGIKKNNSEEVLPILNIKSISLM